MVAKTIYKVFFISIKNSTLTVDFKGKVAEGVWKYSGNMQQLLGGHPCRSLISIKLLGNFGNGVLLQICCTFSEHLFLGIRLGGCF